MESVLLEFDTNLKNIRDIEKVKKDVKLLQERENKVTGDIKTSQVREARSYRLPLSILHPSESNYMFDPYIGGKPHGPYVLRLKYTR